MHPSLRSSARTALVAGVVGAAAFAGGAATANTFIKPSAPDNPLIQRGCVIRFDTRDAEGKTQPRIHANDSHYCVGLSGEPTVDDRGRLVITSDAVGGREAIVNVSLNGDETLVKKGITCGASGGGSTTRISCFDRSGAIVSPHSPEMYDKYANLWLGWTTWRD